MTDTTTDTSKAEVAKGAAQDTAHEAADQGRQVASTAAEKGQEVAATAADQAKQVASAAGEQVATLGGQAVGQARTVLDSAAGDVRGQLEQRLQTLVGSARTTVDEINALVEGRPEEAGRTKELAQSASQHVSRLADRADELGVQGVVEEVADLARRRPVLFLAGAATAGILVGRMAKAGREVQGGSGNDSASGAVGTGYPVPDYTTTPGWGETAAGAPVVAGATSLDPAPLPPPAPAPLPPPAAPGTDPAGSASGWVGS